MNEIDTLKVYEKNFHSLNEELVAMQKQNIELEVDREDLTQMNRDLLEQLNDITKEKEDNEFFHKTDALIIQEQKA
jgi:hypothetical protein